MSIKNAIEIDDPNGWSNSLKTLLIKNREILSKFAERQIEIDSLPSTERWDSINEFATDRDNVLSLIDGEIHDSNLIGYHCTRLTENEAQEIRSHGLQPLSKDFITKRIERLVKEHVIEKEMANFLISKNDCNHQYRKDRIWFVCGKSILKDSSSVIRLFRSWGGEALYNSHESDKNSGPTLKNIGRPYIIKANLPPNDLKLFVTLSQKIEEAFLISNGIRTSNKPQFDTFCKKPVLPSQVVEVISIEDPKFEELTNCSNWLENLN